MPGRKCRKKVNMEAVSNEEETSVKVKGEREIDYRFREATLAFLEKCLNDER